MTITMPYQRSMDPLVSQDVVVVTRPTRTLLAMEHPLFSAVMRVALTDRGGYDVVGTCTRLTELPAMAKRCRPDVVLMEVESVTCDGVAVLKDLLEILPQCAVLALSAAPGPDLLSRVMSAGAAGFLSFESDVTELLAAVQAAAQGQVVLSGRRLEALVRHLTQRSAPPTANGPGGPLTERECEVLQLLAAGASTPAIAESMLISPHTARTHVQNVLVKLGVHSRLEAAAYAASHHLLTTA